MVVLLSDGMSEAAVVEVDRAGMDVVVVPSSLEVVAAVVVAVLSSLVVVLSAANDPVVKRANANTVERSSERLRGDRDEAAILAILYADESAIALSCDSSRIIEPSLL